MHHEDIEILLVVHSVFALGTSLELLQLRLGSYWSTFEDCCKNFFYSFLQPATLKHRRNCRWI